jgi:hypothetical protein
MKKLLLLIGICCSFAAGYSAMTEAFPAGGMYGRAEHHGYFTNAFSTEGTFLLPKVYDGDTNAIPASLNNATELINFMKGSSGLGGDAQRRTGASFIMQTMIGTARNRPPTAAQIAEWEGRVRAAERQGRIDWYVSYSFCINSHYLGPGGINDDAWMDDCQTNTAIVFRDSSGRIVYVIKRACGNPVGNISPIPDDIDFTITGRSTVNNASPEPGDTIQFRHFLRNAGPSNTGSTAIWWAASDTRSGALTGGPASSGTYNAGQEKNVANEDYTVPAGTPAGTSICRRIGWDPVNESGTHDGRGAPVCAVVRLDFGLTPAINVEINDAVVGATGSVAEVGDKIEFIYSVNNTGTTQSSSTNCTIYGLSRPGYYAVPGTPDSSSDAGYVQPGHGCPRTFPASTNTVLVTEPVDPVPASSQNRTICRSLFITPATVAGGTRSTEVCVAIASKPYLRVYGGDVSAGNGQSTPAGTCTSNNAAAVVSWNKESSGAFAGAGAQFAVMALNQIFDYASALGNSGGAPAGSGLAFANTTVSGGRFGGGFGSLPCISDYFAGKPATTTPFTSGTNLSSLSTGYYATTGAGPFRISGNINPNQRTVLYVTGDVLIDNNITYTGSWNSANVPLFQLVVSGNIYISRTVTQLDGVYIAQRNGSSGGTMYTCANTTFPAVSAIEPSSGSVYANCSTRLTINGAFVANQVRFLRSAGTLRQSNAGEAKTSTNIAEIFNYNPALWMAQPPALPGGSNEYDAITSLPPIL